MVRTGLRLLRLGVLFRRVKVAKMPNRAPVIKSEGTVIVLICPGPPNGRFPRIEPAMNPRPRISEAFPRVIRLTAPLERKPRAKKYATINTLAARKKVCNEEYGKGGLKMSDFGRRLVSG